MPPDPTIDRPRSRIVVASQGSLGDMYPYFAIALGLKARGHELIVATGECYRQKIEAMGIDFRPVRPDSDWVADTNVMRRMAHPRWGLTRVIRELWLPALRDTYDDLLAATEGADLLVAMQANYASPLVAEKTGIPWASAIHVPLGLSSAYDPPVLPGFVGLSKKLRPLGPAFWSSLRSFLKWRARAWAKPWYRLRAELGLPPDTTASPLTDKQAPLLHLALFSKMLADKQPDWPPQTVITGFPWYEANGTASLAPALVRFLDDGPPPIVFTLGTAIAADAGAAEIFEHSAAAAKRLGRRAVLVLHQLHNRPHVLPDGVVAVDYAPFSELFPRTSVIVHHGGIGTTGLAMRSGRPSLIVPSAWDQPDNAERTARLGIARTMHRSRYTPDRVAAELQHLLDDRSYHDRAAEVAEILRLENGVEVACDAIESLLWDRPKITFTT